MSLFRWLVVTWLLAMRTFTTVATANNFDGRYLRAKRARETPWQLTLDVPCNFCVLTAKLGLGPLKQLPRQEHFNDLGEYVKELAHSRNIPLNKVKRRLNVKRHVSISPGLFRVIGIDQFINKASPILKLKSLPRRLNKKNKSIRHNHMHGRRKKGRITPIPQLVSVRKIRCTGNMSSPSPTTSKMPSDTPNTVSTRVKEVPKIFPGPKCLDIPKTQNTTVDNEEKTSKPNSTLFTLPPSSDPTAITTTKLPVSVKSTNDIKTMVPTPTLPGYTKEKKQVGTTSVVDSEPQKKLTYQTNFIAEFNNNNVTTIDKNTNKSISTVETTESITPILPGFSKGYTEKVPLSHQAFAKALDKFERKFYKATFGKLSSISPSDRKENGISFVQSGLFLYSILNALCLEVNKEIKQELDTVLGLGIPSTEKLNIMRHVLDSLPASGDVLKLRWSSRLLVNGSWSPSTDALNKMRIKLEHIDGTATAEQLTKTLNYKVEEDSGGAMRNTFEEDELAGGVRGVLLNTIYLRPRWRSAPTLLNGSRVFRDAPGAPTRTARMIRINDIMNYAFLPEWDAEAVEILYTTPGLSLLLLVPRGLSLNTMSQIASAVSLTNITARMRKMRVAATLPIYTLRMTLLLPNKLQAMGISRLMDANATTTRELRVSHAVQRIMFWAEAGRNAFKDDGIEWDEAPELEMLVDRPYLFYVRWRNVTIMNGNFVL